MSDAATTNPVQTRINDVGERLQAAFTHVLQELPGTPDRPLRLAAALNVNRNIAGRILSVTSQNEGGLGVAHAIPGPDPLRKVLRGAKRRDVSDETLQLAEDAIREFEVLIRDVAGDRPGLDAIISSMLPAARDRFELGAKHAVFRGASLLRGAMADTWIHTAIVHPSTTDTTSHDVAYLYGTLGLRRIRPGTIVKFTYQQFGTETNSGRTLDGTSISQSAGDELDDFCTRPVAPMNCTEVDDGVVYSLGGDEVGPASAVDKLLAELRPNAMRRTSADGGRRKSLFVAPAIPVKELIFDVLLHDDAFPGADPDLILYDTAVDGMASVNDRARDSDQLDMRESITMLGRGVSRIELDEMPSYRALLLHACETLGWDGGALRGYRCRIQYPMHGLQACMAFDA